MKYPVYIVGSCLICNVHGVQLLNELDGHLCYVNALCFNDEGSLLYSGDSLGTVRIWNITLPDEEAAAASSKCELSIDLYCYEVG